MPRETPTGSLTSETPANTNPSKFSRRSIRLVGRVAGVLSTMGSPRNFLGGGPLQGGRCLSQFTSSRNPVMDFAIRSFSMTSVSRKSTMKLGHLPTFPQTSSTELDSLLNHLREELFIPVHILVRQRQLMYRPKNHHLLLQEDIYYDVDGEPIHIKPKGPQPSLPRSLFTKALKLISTPKDYDILPDLVLGYNQAGRPLKEKHIEHMIRKLSLSGRIDLIFTAFARDVKYSEMKLTLPMYREIARGLTVRSRDSDRSLPKVFQLPELLKPPTSYAKTSEDQIRLENDPVVNGIFAGMFAQTCLLHNEGLDWKDKVMNAIKKFLIGYDEMNLMEWNPPIFNTKLSFEIVKRLVLDYSFLLSGLQKAERVLRETKNSLGRTSTMTTVPVEETMTTVPVEERTQWLLLRVPWLTLEIVKLEQKLDEWKSFLKENNKFLQGSEEEHLGLEIYAKAAERLAKQRELERTELEETENDVEKENDVEEKANDVEEKENEGTKEVL